ncbi:MAG: alpha-amylase/4-alpha-glucanotransferase domain-containing protein [Acidobacteriota bacterium]
MAKVYLGFAIHGHQPIGNFDNIIKDAYQRSYLPFLDTLARHDGIKIALHFTGSLLTWIKQHYPEYLANLAQLVRQGRIELLSGGFYEPILAMLPFEDRCEQIIKLNHFLETEFGIQPSGMWMAERVWESELAAAIASVGIQYTILDDSHFYLAGLRDQELYGYYITEEQGQTLKLVPANLRLRHLIPFANPAETVQYLRTLHERSNTDLLIAMGDSIEKFGVWPQTHQRCYQHGWLDQFYSMLEHEQNWLETIRLGDYLTKHIPIGRVYLPTTSYTEMMQWTLPAQVAQEFAEIKEQLAGENTLTQFAHYLHCGYWRNFLVKYRESNLIHKKMLEVSQRARTTYNNHKIAGRSAKVSPQATTAPLPPLFNEPHAITLVESVHPVIAKIKDAYECLLRGQCNDAYWHGVFGGLYAPHLRSALLMNLIKADRLLDEVVFEEGQQWLEVREHDFDADGINEVEINTRHFSAIYDVSEGGLSMLDFKPRTFSLINSLQRRYQAYHAKMPEIIAEEAATTGSRSAATLFAHDSDNISYTKAESLDNCLIYDNYPRNCFTVYALADTTIPADFHRQTLVGKAMIVQSPVIEHIQIDGVLQLRLHKRLDLSTIGSISNTTISQSLRFPSDRAQVQCTLSLNEGTSLTRVAIEFNINLLASDAPDRYLHFANEQHRLHWCGIATQQRELRVVDEYLQVAVCLSAAEAIDWWVYPIFSLSQSQEGLEQFYQGSCILAILPVTEANKPPRFELSLSAEAL